MLKDRDRTVNPHPTCSLEQFSQERPLPGQELHTHEPTAISIRVDMADDCESLADGQYGDRQRHAENHEHQHQDAQCGLGFLFHLTGNLSHDFQEPI